MTEDKEIKKVKEMAEALAKVSEHFGCHEVPSEMGACVDAMLRIIKSRPDMEEFVHFCLAETTKYLADIHNKIVVIETVLGKPLSFNEFRAGPPKEKP